MMRAGVLLLLTIAILGAAGCQEPVSILAMGQVDPSYSPISDYLKVEPSLQGTLVVSRSIHAGIYNDQDLRRFIRIYMPRTYEDLLTYDFMVFDQPILTYFDNAQIQRMYRALKEEGVGSLAFTQSSYAEMYEPWMNSELPHAFPHDQDAFIALGMDSIEPYNLKIPEEDSLPRVIWPYRDFGIEKVKPFGYTRMLFKKEGTVTWATAVDIPFPGTDTCPLLISWEYGEKASRIWATGDQFVSPMWGYWWGGDGKERFALDIFTNIVWYSTRRELPIDPLLVHALRTRFADYRIRVAVLYSLLEFVEKFGANSGVLQDEIIRSNALASQAEAEYLGQEFDSSQATLQGAFDMTVAIEERAVRVKERALLWVYVIEWSVVTGTMAVVGFTTWTLMVKRRMFREVKSTRSA